MTKKFSGPLVAALAVGLTAGAALAKGGDCPNVSFDRNCGAEGFLCRIHYLYPWGAGTLVIDRNGYVYDEDGHRAMRCPEIATRYTRTHDHRHHHHKH